jgi:curved DNA-binding protein CbpA
MAAHPRRQPDFYAVLGLAHGASSEAVKKAYRALARRHHPDTNAGSPASEQRFKAIAAAYTVLSHPERRTRYDLMRGYPAGAAPPQQGTPPPTARRRPSRPRPAPEPAPTPAPAATAVDALLGWWTVMWWSPLWSTPRPRA